MTQASSTRPHPWTEADVPDQAGRTAVITGGNSGIGLETARVLVTRGAHVVLACRDLSRGAEAAARIAERGGGLVSVVRLDLASLASVREAAGEIRASHPALDLLINNAGVMVPPYGTTEDGFELQFGVNHLGHFALTGLLLDLMLPAAASRVVTVSSNVHRAGRMNFADLQSAARYRRMAAYAQSKLANLLFSYALQGRLARAGTATIALAAHPGTTATQLSRHLPAALRVPYRYLGGPFQQNARMGALPSLRAATDPAARGAEYYGPGGFGEFTGYPRRVSSSARSRDAAAQQRLWQESERLTGVTYPV